MNFGRVVRIFACHDKTFHTIPILSISASGIQRENSFASILNDKIINQMITKNENLKHFNLNIFIIVVKPNLMQIVHLSITPNYYLIIRKVYMSNKKMQENM